MPCGETTWAWGGNSIGAASFSWGRGSGVGRREYLPESRSRRRKPLRHRPSRDVRQP